MSDYGEERSLTETPTWAVAVVVFVMLAISILIEHLIHIVEKLLDKKHKPTLIEALEKVKAELMLLGFISLLLTILQDPIASICVSEKIASTWHPCKKKEEPAAAAEDATGEAGHRRLLQLLDSGTTSVRRSLAAAKGDKCAKQNKVAFVSAYGIHQLHIFIFVLAITHILYCIITYILGKTKMRRWKSWEDETKTIEYQYHNDPERFRFARDTSFGRRHLKLWSKSPIVLWIVSFFRQFFGSVNKVDYFTLRHGFITAHLAPGSEASFNFQKYINRSLEEDFKVVVGITPVIWFIAVLFLLINTHGWFAYLWLPFIPLIIILLVGAKLQMIITQMGLRIQEKGDVVKGAPIVQPGDELFWFGRPRLLLFLIHVVLFQNAFQLAIFAWSVYSDLNSCFHAKTEDIVIRITMGVVIQVLCSYVTLPLYALVTQMGSSMRPTIFNDKVATALKSWQHNAKKHTRHGKNSASHTPMSSKPGTPHMSPVHLLHNHRSSTAPNSSHNSPRNSNFDNDNWDPEALRSLDDHDAADAFHHSGSPDLKQEDIVVQNPNSLGLTAVSASFRITQRQSSSSKDDFTFRKE